MGLNERVNDLHDARIAAGKPSVPMTLQGVGKPRISEVLRVLDLETQDRVDVVFALLDNTLESWFSKAASTLRFSDGASTAFLGCHVGILQHGAKKLDREGRDYWIKPLRDIGAVDAVTFVPGARSFVAGHVIAKSSNSAYRLAPEFMAVLKAPAKECRALLSKWAAADALRMRLEFRGQAVERSRNQTSNPHVELIRACCEEYAPRFLPGFQVLFVDDADGDRITEEDRENLSVAGLSFRADDPMPDVLLHNRETDEIWVIEAVTSDGEVDEQKVRRMCDFAARNGKDTVSFTTAYPSWKVAAERQTRNKNIAVSTYVWIREDASKHYKAESFDAKSGG